MKPRHRFGNEAPSSPRHRFGNEAPRQGLGIPSGSPRPYYCFLRFFVNFFRFQVYPTANDRERLKETRRWAAPVVSECENLLDVVGVSLKGGGDFSEIAALLQKVVARSAVVKNPIVAAAAGEDSNLLSNALHTALSKLKRYQGSSSGETINERTSNKTSLPNCAFQDCKLDPVSDFLDELEEAEQDAVRDTRDFFQNSEKGRSRVARDFLAACSDYHGARISESPFSNLPWSPYESDGRFIL